MNTTRGSDDASRPGTADPGGTRNLVLARVRAALVDVESSTPEEDTPVPWRYGRATPTDDLIARFAETVDDYRAQVRRVSALDVPAAVVDALSGAGVRSVVVPDGLNPVWRHAVEASGFAVTGDTAPLTNTQLDATGAVVTAAAVGIAETGTIVLDHAADQGRRALTLVPDVHVCVVFAHQVVSDVAEAVARLAPAVRDGRPLTWISGPSATSDIELDRVEGVHGPRTLVMVLAD